MNLLAASPPVVLTLDDVLSPYVVVFVVAFVVAFITTPIMRRLAVRNGVVDLPDLKRKNHLQPVAYLGGVAILLGWVAAVSASSFIQPHIGGPWHHVRFPLCIVLGATAITLTGLADDVYGIRPHVKIGGQLIAAAALASQDVGVTLVQSSLQVAGVAHTPYWLTYTLGAVVIVVFVVGGCNAVNLLDGLDGLATGVGAIAMSGLLFIALWVAIHIGAPKSNALALDMVSDPVRIVMCLAVLGALLGFLPYNFNPANIFMGDAGSLLVGYLCVSTILLFAHAAENGPLLIMAALIIFALPITDTSLAIVRRKLRGESILTPDNHHLHHQILRAAQGLKLGPNASVKIAVLSMYLMSVLFAILGCLMVYLRWRYVLTVFGVIFASILVMAYKSGHHRVLLERLGETPAATPPSSTAATSAAAAARADGVPTAPSP